jgi:hypothetical protein
MSPSALCHLAAWGDRFGTLEWVLDTATASRGKDRGGYRSEFISLVQKALALRAAPQGRD